MIRKLSRRQFLMSGLLTGMTVTAIHEALRQQRRQAEQQRITEIVANSPRYLQSSLETALAGDTQTLDRVETLQSSVKRIPPQTPYQREMSKILIQCCRLGTEQYLFGKFDPKYTGSISMLPSFGDAFRSFTQVTSIQGPERAVVRDRIEVPSADVLYLRDPIQNGLDFAESELREFAGQAFTIRRQIPVYWGFALESPKESIIAFRGTQQQNEWLDNFQARQVDASTYPHLKFQGRVHAGFIDIYSRIADATIAAAKRLDPSRPCYITGHSLGGAIAIFAALDIATRIPALRPQIRLYTYATPRIGNRVFVEAHSQLLPNAYRVSNMADAFSLLPPLEIGEYLPIGEEWSFTRQRGDFVANHFVSTYRSAIDQQLEVNMNEN